MRLRIVIRKDCVGVLRGSMLLRISRGNGGQLIQNEVEVGLDVEENLEYLNWVRWIVSSGVTSLFLDLREDRDIWSTNLCF